MTDKLLDALRLIEKQANNFTTYSMDDDDPEEHAMVEQAQDEIAEASAAIKAAFAAQRAMLAALKAMWIAYGDNMERHGMNGDDTWADEDHVDWQRVAPDARHAIEQAEKAGITTGEKS